MLWLKQIANDIFVIRKVENYSYKFKKVAKYGAAAGLLNAIAFSSQAFFFYENGDAGKIYTLGALSIIIPTIIFQISKKESRPSQVEFISYIFAIMAIFILMFD